MEIWRVGYDTAPRPKVVSTHNLAVALVCHLAAFVLFWLYSACHGLFDSHDEPKIEFFDPTVVVVENLDGNPDEPPPLKKVEPEPPPPPPPKAKPRPKPKKEDPKALEKMATNVVKKVEKKETKKKEDPPKKTAKELREERMQRIRSQTKQVSKTTVVQQQPNGKTDKRPPNWEELLNKGYKPGPSTNLAPNEESLGFSLVKSAFEAKWDKPPWTDTMKPMVIRVWFGNGGKIVNYKLESSSGDARADLSIKSAASRVGSVPALPVGFIDKYRSKGVPIRFTVTPQ